MRDIFNQLVSIQKRLVLHNGLLDLAFLYQAFYGPMPKTMAIFVADLACLFPGGIIDTKYLSDYVTRDGTSFLGYLYKR
jgi:target of EGR1 protein 1